jgi:hypothetical protein
MRLIGHMDYRFRILMLPSPVPTAEDDKEHNRKSQHKEIDKDHRSLHSTVYLDAIRAA